MDDLEKFHNNLFKNVQLETISFNSLMPDPIIKSLFTKANPFALIRAHPQILSENLYNLLALQS